MLAFRIASGCKTVYKIIYVKSVRENSSLHW
jgi:hypothetical protein